MRVTSQYQKQKQTPNLLVVSSDRTELCCMFNETGRSHDYFYFFSSLLFFAVVYSLCVTCLSFQAWNTLCSGFSYTPEVAKGIILHSSMHAVSYCVDRHTNPDSKHLTRTLNPQNHASPSPIP